MPLVVLGMPLKESMKMGLKIHPLSRILLIPVMLVMFCRRHHSFWPTIRAMLFPSLHKLRLFRLLLQQ